MALIEVRDLHKSFGDKKVLRGLNLTVEKGETVVILGRSGVGKSVLLKHLIGMLKPDSGTIDVDCQRISSLRHAKLYKAIRRMGMLFQSAALFDSMTVAENTGFYLREHERPSEEELTERVSHALALVDLAGTEELYPSSLSGGMRKRAGLARLICYRPDILLYDEPTTGLDPITSNQINQQIVKTQGELNATSIVITHDIRSALEVGDRLALHHEGQIVFIAPKEDFLRSDHPVIRSFLDNAEIRL